MIEVSISKTCLQTLPCIHRVRITIDGVSKSLELKGDVIAKMFWDYMDRAEKMHFKLYMPDDAYATYDDDYATYDDDYATYDDDYASYFGGGGGGGGNSSRGGGGGGGGGGGDTGSKNDVIIALAQLEITTPSQTVKKQQVTKAYKKLAMKFHPDKSSSFPPDVRLANQQRMKKINNARDFLMDFIDKRGS